MSRSCLQIKSPHRFLSSTAAAAGQHYFHTAHVLAQGQQDCSLSASPQKVFKWLKYSPEDYSPTPAAGLAAQLFKATTALVQSSPAVRD